MTESPVLTPVVDILITGNLIHAFWAGEYITTVIDPSISDPTLVCPVSEADHAWIRARLKEIRP